MSTNASGICLNELRQNTKVSNHDSTLLDHIWRRQIQKKSCASIFPPTCSNFPFSSLINVYIRWWTRGSSVGIVTTIARSRKHRNFVLTSNRDKGVHSSPKGPQQCDTPGNVLTPGVKQLGREAKHSPPSSVVVKMSEAVYSQSPLHLHDLHSDKFNVTVPGLVIKVSSLAVWTVYCACHCQLSLKTSSESKSLRRQNKSPSSDLYLTINTGICTGMGQTWIAALSSTDLLGFRHSAHTHRMFQRCKERPDNILCHRAGHYWKKWRKDSKLCGIELSRRKKEDRKPSGSSRRDKTNE